MAESSLSIISIEVIGKEWGGEAYQLLFFVVVVVDFCFGLVWGFFVLTIVGCHKCFSEGFLKKALLLCDNLQLFKTTCGLL